MESEEFMLLPANQLIDIISSDELNVRSEEQVFNAVMAWVKYSIQERRPQLPQVSRNASLRNCVVLHEIICIRLAGKQGKTDITAPYMRLQDRPSVSK